MRAIWNGQAIAESDDTVVVEGNHYFPRLCERARAAPVADADDLSVEGAGVLLQVEVDGSMNQDAAWYYEDSKPAAVDIQGRVAFWKGVTVIQ